MWFIFSTPVLIRQLWKLKPYFSALVSNTGCSIVHDCALNFGSVNKPLRLIYMYNFSACLGPWKRVFLRDRGVRCFQVQGYENALQNRTCKSALMINIISGGSSWLSFLPYRINCHHSGKPSTRTHTHPHTLTHAPTPTHPHPHPHKPHTHTHTHILK
jgi:hypothetical protein